MQRSSHIRIDPWSRWANLTMESWELWFEACCKRSATDDVKELAMPEAPPAGVHGTSATADAPRPSGRH